MNNNGALHRHTAWLDVAPISLTTFPQKVQGNLNSDGLQETVGHRKCNLYKLLQKRTALLCRTLMSKCHVNNSGYLLSYKNIMEVVLISVSEAEEHSLSCKDLQ